jgi:AmmeMemoRadiSam system protein B/AmmeMemoRadiSam system protein A
VNALLVAMTVRSPAVAGTFYPSEPDALMRVVNAAVAASTADRVPAKAIVAPHAGYLYSGEIAGSAFRSVAHLGDTITRVVLIGPSHRMAFDGIVAPSATGLETPLGTVPIDVVALTRALTLPEVRIYDAPFDGEHALEVELPFIQALFPRASVVPFLIGDATTVAVERLLEELWGGPETLIVVSSDLSHFLDYAAAQKLDLGTSQAIEAIAPDKIDGNGACGHRALAGLLARAAKLDLRATTRDLRNSGDTSGPRDRVVGYGAYTFEYAMQSSLSEPQREKLLECARLTLRHIAKGGVPDVALPSLALPLRAMRKTFVTLEVDGKFRGCIGSFAPILPLVNDVVNNTYKAATADPRTPSMNAEECEKAAVTISILSHLRPVRFANEHELLAGLRPEIDGLAIRDGKRRALFLPKVWETHAQPQNFLAGLKRKAGLPAGPLPPEVQAFRFTAETFTG